MVINTPDPPKEEPPLSEIANVPVAAAPDSDDEVDVEHEGYTMLPQEANDDEPSEDEDAAVAEPEPLSPINELASFDRGTAEDVRTVWNASRPFEKEPMNQEKADEILNAMKGFNLPSSSIPPWASEIGEEDWKKHLLEKIRSEK